MTPQYQSRVGKNGRCMNACLASIFDIPEKLVPDFGKTDSEWYRGLTHWLGKRGFTYTRVPYDQPPPLGYHTIEGISPRGGMHATVGKDGKMIWDPHPQDGTGRGLKKPMFWGVLARRK